MNARDRSAVDRIDEVIREIGTLLPPNPADMKVIADNLRIAVAASKDLAEVIDALRRGDWETVDQRLRKAEATVARSGSTSGSYQ